MMRFLAFVSILGIALVSSQKPPTISSITQRTIKKLGEQATLSCVAQYNSTFSVLWMKLGRNNNSLPITLTNGDTKVIDDPRFSSQHDPGSSIYSLQIDNIQESDDGFYRCEMSVDSYKKVSAHVELGVARPAFIYDNSSISMVVPEDERLKLECFAGGYPAPRVYWRRQDHKLLFTGRLSHGGNTLEIPSVQRNHSGIYYCYAENGIGRIARRSITIKVSFAPVVKIPTSLVGQAQRYAVNFTCRIEAYPQPAIFWLIGLEPLSWGRHYSWTQVTKDVDIVENTLSIKSITSRQFGIYICRAVNRHGTTDASVELYETQAEWGKGVYVVEEEEAEEERDEEEDDAEEDDTETTEECEPNCDDY